MSRDPFGRKLSPSVTPAKSNEPAAWLPDRLLAHWTPNQGVPVCSVVPKGFESYTRVFHPALGPAPNRPVVRWSSVAEWSGCIVHPEMQWEAISTPQGVPRLAAPWSQEPMHGRCPSDLIAVLCEHLARHTRAVGSVWYAMWRGFPDVRAIEADGPRFELPDREYVLLHGQLAAAPDVITSPFPLNAGPSLWWPDDRSWCVATEVDYRWTYVAGPEACSTSIERDDRIEALRTQPQHRGDIDGDRINNALHA